MYEVWYNSVENSCREYNAYKDLLYGLVDDFEIPFTKARTIIGLLSDFGKDNNEFVDNDITVIKKSDNK